MWIEFVLAIAFLIGFIISINQVKYANYIYNHIDIYNRFDLIDELTFMFGTVVSSIGVVAFPIFFVVSVILLVLEFCNG